MFGHCYSRTLGTPTEETWPGVSELPDFKVTFPNWKSNSLPVLCTKLGTEGQSLLQVIIIF